MSMKPAAGYYLHISFSFALPMIDVGSNLLFPVVKGIENGRKLLIVIYQRDFRQQSFSLHRAYGRSRYQFQSK